jgi:hypothetical protein
MGLARVLTNGFGCSIAGFSTWFAIPFRAVIDVPDFMKL